LPNRRRQRFEFLFQQQEEDQAALAPGPVSGRTVPMTRAAALLICTRPAGYSTWRVREAAEHLLAQAHVSEEEKKLASDALKKVDGAPAADANPEEAAEPLRRSRRATGKRA
jgi:hypothetical protein